MYKYDDKQIDAIFDILKNGSVEKEVKLYFILEMLYAENIGLSKARELCVECGIFKEHWMVVDAQATEVFSDIYKTK